MTNPPTEEQQWLSATQVATMLGVSSDTLRYWRDNGSGPPYAMVGGRWRYPVRELEEYLESRVVRP